MTSFRDDRKAAREIAERRRVCRPRGRVPSEEADPSSSITAPSVPPAINFAAMTASNPSELTPSVTGFALESGRGGGQAVRPPHFDGKNIAVKTFIDKMRGCKADNGWSEEASVVHITNQIQDPASVVVWSPDL